MELTTGMPADAPTARVEASTDLDADAVWAVITDPTHPVTASPELVHAEWLDGGPALGAHFRGDNERGDRRWSTTCTVTSFAEGRRYAWTVEALPDPVSSWTYELEGTAAGTRITYTCRLGPGRSPHGDAHDGTHDGAAEGDEEPSSRRLDELRTAMQATLDDVLDRAARPGP